MLVRWAASCLDFLPRTLGMLKVMLLWLLVSEGKRWGKKKNCIRFETIFMFLVLIKTFEILFPYLSWGRYETLDTIHMCNTLQNIRHMESPNIRYWKIVEVDTWENLSNNYQVTALISRVKMSWVKHYSMYYAFVGDKTNIQRSVCS